VVFLGSSLPEEGVIDVIRKLKPDVLCLAASTPAAAAQIASVGRALRVLPDHTTRFGFGGRAFDQDQTLIDQTPGEYLGEHASDAVSRVAAMLQERTQ
jgi:methanogenic corrinoid protein MtbC1